MPLLLPPRPMKAVAGEVPDGEEWAFEVKWDGMRVTSLLGGGEDVARSSNGIDVLARFPELHLLGEHLGDHKVALDGEVVALDDTGRSDFARLQPRMQATSARAATRHSTEVAVNYVVFDLLAVGDLPTIDLPYLERRRLLTDLLEDGPNWLVPAHRVGGGADLFAAAARAGLEGIMAKRIDSPYLPDRRSQSWRKCKVKRRQEFVVGGWTNGEGARSSTLGALHIGYHDPAAPGRPLRYAGKVGSGFSDAVLEDLRSRLEPIRIAGCPFEPVPPLERKSTHTWVEPTVVVEVEFSNWTEVGSVRHPVLVGVHLDKDSRQVTREPI
ncbi:MAG: non-homologous end-joining DNA ligase [Acidimicrobiales bacterium]|nr:non-homologous end-joining DNA ligase [Acidimicrobiales bacterium]